MVFTRMKQPVPASSSSAFRLLSSFVCFVVPLFRRTAAPSVREGTRERRWSTPGPAPMRRVARHGQAVGEVASGVPPSPPGRARRPRSACRKGSTITKIKAGAAGWARPLGSGPWNGEAAMSFVLLKDPTSEEQLLIRNDHVSAVEVKKGDESVTIHLLGGQTLHLTHEILRRPRPLTGGIAGCPRELPPCHRGVPRERPSCERVFSLVLGGLRGPPRAAVRGDERGGGTGGWPPPLVPRGSRQGRGNPHGANEPLPPYLASPRTAR
jgi:hypothetical protein